VVPDAAEVGEPIVDEYAVDQVQLHPTGSVHAEGTVEQSEDTEFADEEAELGHS
jgi:hypothetical protein